jgi:hypothetical protein
MQMICIWKRSLARHPLLFAEMLKILFAMAIAFTVLENPAAQGQGCAQPGADWVVQENSKQGSKEWSSGIPMRFSADFSRRKNIDRIEGYFDLTSLGCGESTQINLVGADQASVEIYRMGYYQGLGARLIEKKKITSGWEFKASHKYLPGQYLFKLKAFNRASTFVPLVISDPSAPSEITFVSSVLTWQSYNQWGGSSLYKGPDGTRETRALEVSFLRPYDGDGSGQFQYMEFPVIKAAEKLGLSMNYATDFDLDGEVNLLSNTKAIVLGGHSEYWTTNMRDAVESAVDRGVNLIVFGGNTAFSRIDIHGSEISNVKEWRTLGRPEIDLLGSQFFFLKFKRDMVIETQQWPFNNLPQNSVIKGIFGYEADTPITFNGPPVETIARSSILPTEKSIPAMSTYYTRASGAGVLNMATNGWVCAMENKCPWGHRFDQVTQRQIRRVTENVLREMPRGPLGNWRTAFTQNNAPS